MPGIEAIKFTFIGVLNSAVILSCQYVLYGLSVICMLGILSNIKMVTVIRRAQLTDATAAHTSIFRVNAVSSVSVMSAVGQSWLSANTRKIVQINGASPWAKPSSENGSAVC